MLKRLLFMVSLVAVVVLAPFSISADVDTLIDFAERYPAETTLAFSAVRLDAETIASLDALIVGLASRIRAVESPEDASLIGGLDQGANELQEGATYTSFIRNWLGDTGAVGVMVDETYLANVESLDDPGDVPLVWMLDVIDKAGAADFMAAVILDEGLVVSIEETDGATIFNFTETAYQIVVTDELAVGGTPRFVEQLLQSTPDVSIVDDPTFDATLELLPADDYAALAYVNQTAVITALGQANVEDFDLGGPFTGDAGGQAVGMTLLDGRTLTVDIVQTAQDLSSLGFVTLDLGAIDPAFASRLPMSAPLVIHSTNLRGIYDAFQTNAAAASELGAQGEMGEDTIQELGTQLETETGLNLETDIISWLTGDYAIFLDFRKELEEATSIFSLLTELPLEFGVLLDASADPAAAARVVDVIEELVQKQADQLAAAAESSESAGGTSITVAREMIGSANALVITFVDGSGNVPFPVEVLIAANDDVFAVGTRSSVQTMITADGGPTADATYTDSTSVWVEEPGAVAYISFPQLLRLINVINAAADEATGAIVSDVLPLFSHWTISANVNADGSANTRFTISIAPE